MVALHFLKCPYNLSDEVVVRAWVENSCWQLLSGMKWFEHEIPIHPSRMTHWRRRMGAMGAEKLLQETFTSDLRVKTIDAKPMKQARHCTKTLKTHLGQVMRDFQRQKLLALNETTGCHGHELLEITPMAQAFVAYASWYGFSSIRNLTITPECLKLIFQNRLV